MMEKILVLLFLVQLWLVIHTSEIPDVNLVYNIPADSDSGDTFPVDVEIRSMSNSLGKLFLLENNTILSPISSSSLPSFDCFSSRQSCEWGSDETWTSSLISNEQLKRLLLPLNGFDLSCEYNNNNCQIHCQNGAESQCSCPSGFSINKDNKTCTGTRSYHYVLSKDTGEFTSPNYPRDYEHNLLCIWLIVTSKGRRIHLSIPTLHSERGLDTITVFDGIESIKEVWNGHKSSLITQSTGNIMMVRFQTDHSVKYPGFSASYYTEVISSFTPAELQSERGVITSFLNIAQSNLCVSVIYSLPPSGYLDIYAEQLIGGRTSFRHIHTNEINEWRISRYVSNSSLDSNDPTKLSVLLSGQKSKIFNVAECSSDGEDVYVLPRLLWRASSQKYPNSNTGLSHTRGYMNNRTRADLQEESDENKCSNGGSYDRNAMKCVCPTGFAGPSCTEACGPNHFGPNCSGSCSSFQKGCKKIIFCNTFGHCTCAAGFTGTHCEKECEPGTYGTNCHNLCGKCKEDSCDIYTGECNDLCENGYYPPFCQHRYAFLSQAPIVKERSWNSVVISINFTNVNGLGTPHLYEVQYKERDSHKWNKTSIQEIDSRSVVLVNVKDLNVGTKYLLRVIIICEDGNSYEDFQVPTVQFETLCQVPNSNLYEMESNDITSSSFLITWKYPVSSDKWCPINSFGIILKDQWRIFSQEVSSAIAYTNFTALLPAHLYTVYICAITEHGKAPCSHPYAVMTNGKGPGKVKHLIVKSRNARNLKISWRRPLFTGGSVKGYRILYECMTRFICEESCRNSSGSLETTENSANLINLLPHVQYKIRIAAYSSSLGPFTTLFATTKSASPDVSPVVSDQPIVSKTNTTVTIQWQPPPCPGLNGQLTGYYFILTSESENGSAILQTGTTNNLQTNFTSLTPMTEYQVNVYAMNSHGWNTNFNLTIPFSSSATVPDAVQNLQVYKKGRRMLGIRWAKPTRVYGTLKSFTVSYHQKGTENKFTHRMSPNTCSGWPHLYCHTIKTNLQPDKQYIVSVAARNDEIEEDGMTSEINTTTRENAPEAPSSLKITRSTSTSFEMNWELPNMFNGELRSFIVNVEHVESLNESACCEYFPVHELPLREESPVYNLEVTGLIPASTYVVSVSAKTITMGPSINATYYTSPLSPTNLKPPQVVGVADDGFSYILKIQPVSTFSCSNCTYLLLVLPPGELPPPVIWEDKLLEKLTKTVNASFYIVSEFTNDEFVSTQEVKIGTGSEGKNGTLGHLIDPKFTAGFYQVGLAFVQRYGHAVSVDIARSNRVQFGDIIDLAQGIV